MKQRLIRAFARLLYHPKEVMCEVLYVVFCILSVPAAAFLWYWLLRMVFASLYLTVSFGIPLILIGLFSLWDALPERWKRRPSR